MSSPRFAFAKQSLLLTNLGSLNLTIFVSVEIGAVIYPENSSKSFFFLETPQFETPI